MPNSPAADRIELQDLMLNYAAGVDERDIERYRACFTQDVEVVNFGTQTYHSCDEWVSYVWSALEQYSATQHLLGPQLATIRAILPPPAVPFRLCTFSPASTSVSLCGALIWPICAGSMDAG